MTSIFEWLLSQYGTSPVCVAALIGLLSFLQPPEACARDVSTNEAMDAVQKKEPGFRIIDVRTQGEYKEGHLPGSLNMNVADPDFPVMLRELDRNAPVLVYCRTGRRSGFAVKIMERMGFVNILHMKDGWVAWKEAGMPIDYEVHQ